MPFHMINVKKWRRRGLCLLVPACLLPAFGAELVLQEAAAIRLGDNAEIFSGGTRSSQGDLYFLGAGATTISHFSPQGVLLNKFQIANVPESVAAHITVMRDPAVDGHGSVYVPAMWRLQAKQTFSGFFVFDSNGVYSRTIVTVPGIEIRHIAIDREGNIYGLGIDPGYFRKSTDLCLLVHKFSNDGHRITAFSSCPAALNIRTSGIAPGPSLARLTADTDNGRLWISADKVYHVLNASHLLRIFDTTGKQLTEVNLQVPALTDLVKQAPGPMTSTTDILWRVLPAPAGRWLVEWQHAEITEGQRQSFRYMSLHDSNGTAVSRASAPAPNSTLVFADDAGFAYSLRGVPASAGGPIQKLSLVRLLPDVR